MLSRARHDLIAFEELFDSKYFGERVHRGIAELLHAVYEGRIRRLSLSVPSQHGKSTLVSSSFVSWLLGKDPTKRIGLASYSADLSKRFSMLARWRVGSPLYQKLFPDTKLQVGAQRADNWSTTARGFVKAAGIGGGFLGVPLDCLIIDDPFASWKEAHSAAQREHVWEWYASVGMQRLAKDGVIICIQTRWHPDDLIGRLQQPERQKQLREDRRWVHVNLEALAPADDPLGRPLGEPLAPRLHSLEDLEELRSTLGSYLWDAMYCGRPRPRGGNYMDAKNLILVDAAPEGLRWVRFWDLAASEKERSDFTGGAAAAQDKLGNLWIRDIENVQLEWPKARALIVGIAKNEAGACGTVGVEAVGGFKTSVQNLREAWPPTVRLIEVGVDEDKICRAIPWMTMAENKKVMLVRGKNLEAFLSQVAEFPKGEHDDMIDAVSGATALLRTLPQAPHPVAPAANARDYKSIVAGRRVRTLLG